MTFTRPAACRAALEAHRRESDPCRAFLEEHYAADPQAGPVPTCEVYGHYKVWCDANGYKHPLSSAAFGRQVRRVFGLEESSPKRFGGQGVQKAWLGLAERRAA